MIWSVQEVQLSVQSREVVNEDRTSVWQLGSQELVLTGDQTLLCRHMECGTPTLAQDMDVLARLSSRQTDLEFEDKHLSD